MEPSAEEAIVWRGKPRRNPLEASDWVFLAQWAFFLAVLASLLPPRALTFGAFTFWRWTLPLLVIPGIALQLAWLRSHAYAVSADALYFTRGLVWRRTRRLACPEARLAERAAGRYELRGRGGVRLPLRGLDALDAETLREALESEAPESEAPESERVSA